MTRPGRRQIGPSSCPPYWRQRDGPCTARATRCERPRLGKEERSMNGNRTSRMAADQQLADGLAKNAALIGVFVIGGQQVKPADVVQVLQSRVVNAKAVTAAPPKPATKVVAAQKAKATRKARGTRDERRRGRFVTRGMSCAAHTARAPVFLLRLLRPRASCTPPRSRARTPRTAAPPRGSTRDPRPSPLSSPSPGARARSSPAG